MDVQPWYGSLPPEDAGAGIDAWCWTWAIGCNPVVRSRYTGALPLDWFAPDLLSGIHVSEDADLAACTPKTLRLAGVSDELVDRVAPYCGLVGVQAVQALRNAPLRLSGEEAAAVEAAWRAFHE